MDEIVFYVNGVEKRLRNPSQDLTLLTYLRKELLLSGAKLSCGEGGCGACTVTISRFSAGRIRHAATNACLTKVCSLHGTSVATVEGLGNVRDGLHPVQERIFKSHGSQCGFCTPGMVMSMSSLLRENETPDIEDVHRCLQGNLCRCTGYRPILEGLETFCRDFKEEEERKDLGDGEEVLRVKASEFKKYSPCVDDPKVPDAIGKNTDYKLVHLKDNEGRDWFCPGNLTQLLELQRKLDCFELYGGGTGRYETERCVPEGTPVVQITGIEELKTFDMSKSEIRLGSCLTLTEATELVQKMKPKKNSSVSAFLEVISAIASQQVRNVATLGGCVMWGHACSDLMPVLLATKARLDVQTPKERTCVIIDEDFVKKGLPDRSIILALIIPIHSDEWMTRFFRSARRKEFDLAIANVCVHAKVTGKVIEEISVAVGGAESNLAGAKHGSTTLATGLMDELKGRNINEVSKDDLGSWISADKKMSFDDKAPGDFMRLRQTLIANFILNFLEDPNRVEGKKKLPRLATLTYQRPDPGQPPQDPVTRPIAHLWAAEQASGEAVYVDDIKPYPNEVQVILVQSSRPHARIVKVDFSKALKQPGVIGTISQDDLSKEQNLWGLLVRDEVVFAGEEVLYHGQIIAGLVCTSVEAGERARKLVEIEYEDLPPILSIQEAVDKKSFLTSPVRLERDQGVDPKQVGKMQNIKGSMHIGGQETFYMEPHTVLVVPTGEKEELVIYHTTQEPSKVQSKVCEILKIPENKVIVKVKRLGGAFGGKERMHNAILAAIAAWKFRLPTRLVFSRREDMEVTGHRHELVVSYDVDYDEEGRLLKTDFHSYINAGCSTDLSVYWAMELLTRIGSGYTLRRFKAEAAVCLTNSASNTAFRGFGGPESVIVIEHIIEQVAHNLKLDPLAVRWANLTRDGDLLHFDDSQMTGCMLARCWEECKARSNFAEKRKAVDMFNRMSKSIKRGLTMVPMKFMPTLGAKMLTQGAALVRIYRDGSVLVSHGGIEMGQGLNTKMVQVASRALGIDHSRIHLMDTSTETIPNATATGGSIGTDFNGPAVMKACEILRARLEPFRKANPDAGWDSWVMMAYLERVNLSAVGFYDWSETDYDFGTNRGKKGDYWTYGVGTFEVEVDCHTGDVTVVSSDMVMDVGKSLNPAIDIGQIEGSFLQALGYVTTEQLLHDPKTGRLLTTGPGTYKLPIAANVPLELNVHLLRNEEGPTSAVYSSKGIGEPPFVLATAGIVVAVRQAVGSFRADRGSLGWFQLEVPMTADKIRAAAMDDDFQRGLDCRDKIAVEM